MKGYVLLALIMAMLFMMLDLSYVAFYIYPWIHPNSEYIPNPFLFSKYIKIDQDTAVVCGLSQIKHVLKIIGIWKHKSAAIKTWLLFAIFKGIYVIYKLGDLFYHLAPTLLEEFTKESIKVLMGTILFAIIVVVVFVVAIYVAYKAYKSIEEDRQIVVRV